MEVKSLNNELRANICSGYCINNVTQCVNELVLNSLDAKSSHIAVRVNLISFRIQVVDDGEGITESNLEHVGKRNYTNKCHTLNDLEQVRKHFGYKGEALASIATNAKVVKITSRAWNANDSQTCAKTFLKIIEAKRHIIEETVDRPSGGTTVTIQGFMFNLPVRQKRTKDLEFNDIQANLQRLFILHPNVVFSLRDDSTKKILFSSTAVETIETALRQQIDDLEENCIKYYSTKRRSIQLKTLIYLREYKSNKWQLFYVNKLPIKSTQLTNFVNEILSKSELAKVGEATDDPKRKRTGNNCGKYLYLFNIACPRSKYQVVNVDEVEFHNVNSILKLIEKHLRRILENENLGAPVMEKKKSRRPKEAERIIRLSGFAGAFKASAVRKPGEQVVENEEFHKFSSNLSDQDVPKYNTNMGNCKEKGASVESSITPTSYLEAGRFQPCVEPHDIVEEEEEEWSGKQANSVMNIDRPLETTSTIGKNYVFNKFMETNPFHKDRLPRRLLAEQSNEIIGRRYLVERTARKSEWERQQERDRVRHMEMEIERVRSTERRRKIEQNREPLYLMRNDIDSYRHCEHLRRCELIHSYDDWCDKSKVPGMNVPDQTDFEFNQRHRNDAALARYYRHKRKLKQKPVAKQAAQPILWSESPFHHFMEPAPVPARDIRFPIPERDDPQWKIPVESPQHKKLRKYHHKNNSPFNNAIYQFYNEHSDPPRNISRVPKDCQRPITNFRVERKYLDAHVGPHFGIHGVTRKFDFPPKLADNFDQYHHDFEQLDKKTFNFHFDCPRTPRQIYNFTQTVGNLDLDARNDDFFSRPEVEHCKRASFFRMRASEKTTRLKRCFQRMKISSRARATTLMSTNSAMNNYNIGARTNTKTIISCTKRTVVTAVSSRYRENTKMRKKLNRNVKTRANKGTSISVNFQQRIPHSYETITMMEQSIQCTIGNHKEQNLTDELGELPAIEIDPNLVCSKPANIKVINNIIMQPMHNADVISNKNCANNVESVEHIYPVPAEDLLNPQEDIIEGTPSPNFTPWASHIHPHTFNPCKTVAVDGDIVFSDHISSQLQINRSFDQNISEVNNKMDLRIPEKLNDSVMFNLSIAVKELAAEWSLNQKWSLPFGTSTNKEMSILNTGWNPIEIETDEYNAIASSEWSRKIDEQGGSYYINKRTGNTISQLPGPLEIFDLAQRPRDLPKGFSQNLKAVPQITETVSNDTKRAFHAAVCESYDDDDLAYIKWMKHYLQDADYNEFFKSIYDQRFVVAELQMPQLPKMRQAPHQLNAVTFTKDLFEQLDVLRQYDRKFIVAVWQPRTMIVAFDQHAVHERIRVQTLWKKYVLISKGIFEATLELLSKAIKPFELACNRHAFNTCQQHSDTFQKYGLCLTCPREDILLVHSVPECIYNKTLRRFAKRQMQLIELTKLLIYEIVDSIYDAISSNQWMPRMLDIFNDLNRNVEGAVMFGDVLDIEECVKLIHDLASCDLPFQCAHGRPTCVPLSEVVNAVKEEPKLRLGQIKRKRM